MAMVGKSMGKQNSKALSKAGKNSPKAPSSVKAAGQKTKNSQLASLKSWVFGSKKAKKSVPLVASVKTTNGKGPAKSPHLAPSPALSSKGKVTKPAAAPVVAPKIVKSMPRVRSAVKEPSRASAKAAHAAEFGSESVCREVACEGLSTSGGYCRLHYIKNWKKIKRKELILKERKLNQYIEELVAKYPDKYIEAIRQDLTSDKDFAKVISDLDLDEGVDDFDSENENMDSLIDTIKRDFEDEGDGF